MGETQARRGCATTAGSGVKNAPASAPVAYLDAMTTVLEA